MMLGPFYFKRKAKEALKGNWQTAMVVAFFSGVLLTVGEVYQALSIPIYLYLDGEQVYLAMGQVSRSTWLIYGGLMLLALAFGGGGTTGVAGDVNALVFQSTTKAVLGGRVIAGNDINVTLRATAYL
mgnify:CR=1 FL=1